jgi:hypothetical protein
MLAADFVKRASCGCRASEPPPAPAQSSYGFDVAVLERRQKILFELLRVTRGALFRAGKDWESKLLQNFQRELSQCEAGATTKAFDELVMQTYRPGLDAEVYGDLLRELRRQMLPCLARDPALARAAEDIFHDVRGRLSRHVARSLARGRLDTERMTHALGGVAASLMGAADWNAFSARVAYGMSLLRIGSVHVALYDDDEQRHATLVASSDAQNGTVTHARDPYDAADILPPAAWRTLPARSFVVSPLVVEDEPLGFVVHEIAIHSLGLCEAIRDILAASVVVVRSAMLHATGPISSRKRASR